MSGKRRAIQIPGVSHGPGRPAGSRIGNIIYSANLTGRNPETREYDTDPQKQIAELFATMERFLAAADASLEDVIRVTVTLVAPEHRELVNEEWARCFPDEQSLPARKVSIGPLPGQAIAELEVVAVVE